MLPDEMIQHSPIAAVVSDPRLPDNPIIACNQAFIDLTGFTREEIIGRNCRFLRGPDTEDELTETLRRAIHNRQPALVEIRNYKKDGTPFRNAVMIAPVFDAEGHVEYFLGSQVEVAETGAHSSDLAREEALARVNTLPPRQRQILVEMARGKLNKQVAWELGLSERTIKMHRSAMFKTLGVRSSAEAIRVAVEAGL
ncbi:response regulator transcription factor [Novosphingobium sp. KACC 22771]|uniref:response regulator transcription factor n=1 Tax=Novosphingobium sp. KACC 22771 TaxID=3025670 RepID=UPI002365FD83|nr:PAS domain-containing protein [Novosphingobium sp. KACC 22771]WDF71702.1 PAS domain-containing protein [Novosphingobium sp. KACC 22771]